MNKSGRVLLALFGVTAPVVMIGCTERPLPPEVPYTQQGVEELRGSLGIPAEDAAGEQEDSTAVETENEGD